MAKGPLQEAIERRLADEAAAVEESLKPRETQDATVTPNGYGLMPYYSNRYHLWANDQIMRFVIGDSIGGEDLDFKLQFIMTREDATTMLETALQLLKDTDPKIPPVLK